MKQQQPSGNNLSISVITNRPDVPGTIRRTLAHVYPGVSIHPVKPDATNGAEGDAFSIVDAQALPLPSIERFLDHCSDGYAIILAKDFAAVRGLTHLLSNRRSIITDGDLEGMGLVQCVHHLLERQKLQEQLRKASHHLKELSIRDELTHLINHRHFDELLTMEVKKANRYKRPLGLVIISIKNFAAINEALGHEAADRILVRAAEIIRGAVRDVDITARYGDNEFSIMLPESDETAAEIVAKRVQEGLGTISATGAKEKLSAVTGCGIAALSEDMRTKEELLRTALGALMEAKRNGLNSICTSKEISGRRHAVHENRQLIEQLHERMKAIAREAERGYFLSVMKTIGEIPLVKKGLLQHSERVAFLARRLGERMGMTEAEGASLYRAGLLHDSGKLAIDASLLMKPGALATAESELMKQHPTFALQILGRPQFFTTELDAILHHHERFDGRGYPSCLAGEAIPVSARILAIAEAWDTMITAQPYRTEPLPLDSALSELRNGAGSQFDPALTEKFLSLISG